MGYQILTKGVPMRQVVAARTTLQKVVYVLQNLFVSFNMWIYATIENQFLPTRLVSFQVSGLSKTRATQNPKPFLFSQTNCIFMNIPHVKQTLTTEIHIPNIRYVDMCIWICKYTCI